MSEQRHLIKFPVPALTRSLRYYRWWLNWMGEQRGTLLVFPSQRFA